MQIGIAGPPGAGKTTLFNALAHQRLQVGGYSGAEPNLAVLKVPDERLDKLSALFQPRKHTPAEVRLVDVAGVARGMGHDSSAAILAHLRTVDVLITVIGLFQEGSHPASDLEDFLLELQLADLGQVERRSERLERELRLGGKATAQERALKERELAALQTISAALEAGQPIRSVDLEPEDLRLLANFGFLTQKPMLVVANLGENQPHQEIEALQQQCAGPGTALVSLPAKLESELAELPEDDLAEFMEALGVSESHLGEVLRTCYSLARLVSFFTAGEDECRAWAVTQGASAQEAAGAIHSDLARGFIRAEVIRWDQLLEAGSEANARKRGWLRQEGKSYVVQDGDVLHILFNV